MESFEIKELLTVKGKPGLWKLVRLVPAQRMARVQNLVTEEAVTVKIADIASIDQYKVYLKTGEMSLENVFEFIMSMEEKGDVKTEELDSYDSLSEPEKVKMMNRLVPDYDETQFKHYHLSKILKWYKELDKALDLLVDGLDVPYNAAPDIDSTPLDKTLEL